MRALVLISCLLSVWSVLADAALTADNTEAQRSDFPSAEVADPPATDPPATDPHGPGLEESTLKGRLRSDLIRRLDDNADGMLSADEVSQARAQVTRRLEDEGMGREALQKRFDENGNGTLEPDERRAMRAFLLRRGGARTPRGQAVVERKPRLDQTSLLEKFDEDQNGRLDPAERKEIVAELRRMRSQ